MTADPSIPPIRFATGRGDARLAYQIYGEGPPLVSIPPTAQNIEVAWEWQALRAMFERFGRFSRHLIFDLARRLIESDRFDADAHEELVVALLRSGEIGLARSAHQAWRRAMAEIEVDVPPLDALGIG